MAIERIIDTELHAEDEAEKQLETSLRPQNFDEYIGQERLKRNLRLAIDAAKKRSEPLDHVLLYGPPGLGKTTMATVIANEMGTNLRITSGPAIEKAGDLASILTNLADGDILFIDEIHRLNRSVEEILYPAMEDSALDIMVGKGPSARSIRLKLPRFTVIGATIRLSMVSSPLRGRFGAIYRLNYYEISAMERIIANAVGKLGVNCEADGLTEIARRSRGTPRIGLRLLRRVRDFAQVRSDGLITGASARDALELLGIDPYGLDEMDRRLLMTIIEKFNGGPVGLNTIAASLSEETDTIMEVVEPFLLQLGFINRTPQGRSATRCAYEHLNIPWNKDEPARSGDDSPDQEPLF